jgi:8-oxo-dGTP pyrophosphatase MutT (NUDIX family)
LKAQGTLFLINTTFDPDSFPMDFNAFILQTTSAVAQPLPGINAQLKMSSMRRFLEISSSVKPLHPTYSSVLILLFPVNGEAFTVLMKRPDYGGVHSGQISLPGGKFEPDDETLMKTALREAQEEIGIHPESVHIIGRLTDLYIPPSRYLVSPFIGWTAHRPQFIRDPNEVAEVIEVGIAELFDEENQSVRKIRLPLGIRMKVPAYVVSGNQVIWGATAMILSEFKEVIRDLL